ncbi:uncharacterized protein LOC133196871 [Saccostrea echinata]|uniref:uncharacterized protein LOC133196871 n=1 Tax=Saccostrea echinata TaxID=191078 RepID=UPI002A806D18|nr:uncharacterized protein LOC133196871 [Saccostrea echinata]
MYLRKQVKLSWSTVNRIECLIDVYTSDGPLQTPDICPVLNKSSVPLSESETSLLSKGLNFCPTPHEVDGKQVREDTRAFFRRLRLKEHFSRKNSDDDSYDSSQPQLYDLEKHKLYRPKSNLEPAPGKCGALESYIDAVVSDIEKLLSMPDKAPDNLSKEERSALQSLKNRDDIVIKKADKGSTVVVLDIKAYMAEAHRQLSDERFYKKLDSDFTKEFSTAITKTLHEMFENNGIGINVYETLNPIDCRPGQFYLLHKEGMPGRPIVSAIRHPTEKISEYIDLHLRPHVENLPSYLKDTTDYINKTPSTSLPDHTLLVTMDVTSLYTNIPHDEGIEACREVWDNTTSTLIDGEIEFSLHTKPTDSHLYLMPTSCHPQHTFKGVPKGLATRTRRICSSPALYQEQSSLLKSHLCNRGYKAHNVQTAIDEMAGHDRQNL